MGEYLAQLLRSVLVCDLRWDQQVVASFVGGVHQDVRNDRSAQHFGLGLLLPLNTLSPPKPLGCRCLGNVFELKSESIIRRLECYLPGRG